MTPGSVARRYARALYELARDEGNLEETAAALGEIADAIASLDEGLLASGSLDISARRKLGAAIAAPVGADSTLGRFLRLVAEKDRLAELVGVNHWFLKRLDEDAGRVRASITTVSDPSREELDAIVGAFRKIADREVVPEVFTDADLLGGVIVELEGRVYDGSIRTRLARLAARMAGE